MTTAVTPITAEMLSRLPNDARRELVDGEIIEMSPVGFEHGGIAAHIASRLLGWAEDGPGGYVGIETGCVLARNPDTVRAPDVLYISAARLASADRPSSYWEGAPDLAVEVVSPDDSAKLVRDKVRSYLRTGARLVWVVYPSSHEVIAYMPDGTALEYGETAILANEEVLPGFRCPVKELFM
ncbi:MAG: Uma2 family endonuclease [Herpetosiphonaceae bacterium]|nr:Uma2 family endonuclease [Herpetosiphonaceae bacterium]